MSLSFEALLVLGILGFYLYDSALLLFVNELVFAKAFGQWVFGIPSLHWRLRGKVLYIPNPLMPNAPLFRFAWSTDPEPLAADAVQDTENLISSLRSLSILALLLLVLMLVALPLILFKLGTGFWFILTLALVYLTIIAMLATAYRKRAVFGLDLKDVLHLTFESITCPPFAINLVRKISLRYRVHLNPVEFAHQYLNRDTFLRLVASVETRLEAELEVEDEDSTRSNELRAYRARLAQLAA